MKELSIFRNFVETGNEILRVHATLEGNNKTADILELTIEPVASTSEYPEYSCRLGIERGDNSFGVHQRALRFSMEGKNSIALIRAALDLFADVQNNENKESK